ncbi:glycosyltransferase family 2 protein [Dokdonella sp.]|uniref:glycosyltransferase family 2 protein n=1 Tax=Dokdonella sp. TaxID=2291710 RepID=UPI002F416A52
MSGQASGGRVPIAVVMIALNEAHNLEAVLDNLDGWAEEVFLVDSHSADGSVDIALRRGVHVVQRRFNGFGEQWNFALSELPIQAPWTMKLDPDERLTDRLKHGIAAAIERGQGDALSFDRRLWFMGRPLPVRQPVLRAWRTGRCRFTDVVVNEHPLVEGRVERIDGELEHHDSPDLEHWLDKQNLYTSAEAAAALRGDALAAPPRLFGTSLQRRMWVKRHYRKLPFRYVAMFFYHYVVLGAWRAGRVGYAWSHMRCEVYRLVEYKLREMRSTGRVPVRRHAGPGAPDARVRQY